MDQSKNYWGYLRVSTKKQAKRKGKVDTNLSLSQETQLDIINKYITRVGGVLVGYSIEVESGTNPDRPVLRQVVTQCKLKGYTLITSHLDRLYRNVEAMSKLMNSKIDFVFCDFPVANKLSIHIMAAIAEYMSDQTKEKIKATNTRKKELGIPMGTPTSLTSDYHEKATEVKKDKAYFNEANIEAGELIVDKRNSKEPWTFQRIADHLNAKGKLTRNGKEWTSKGVQLLYLRYSKEPIEKKIKERNKIITSMIMV
jgi:DNA invertase Pin-like site-specific DNA recombinase